MEKKKVLVIDDEVGVTLAVKLTLEQIGEYEVMTENKGAMALSVAKKFKPNLILLDVIMPDVVGGEVAYQLQNNEGTKDIPIVFLTAAATKEETESEKGIIGGHPFIAKPASPEQLKRVIEQNT